MQPLRRTEHGHEPCSLEDVVFGHLPLVKRAARRLCVRHECPHEMSELVSAGLEGLVVALQELAHSADNRHLAFLRSRVHSAMLRHLRMVDHLSRAQRQQLGRFELCRQDLEGRLGRPAESEELAHAFGVSLREVQQLETLRAEGMVRLEEHERVARLDEDHSSSGGRVSEIIEVGERDPLASLLSAENSRLVEVALEGLPDRERLCVVWSFYDNLTLKQIGDKLGFTEARASQLRSSGLRRMGKMLRGLQ